MNADANELPSLSKLIDLTGRRAVVTGAAQGIGLAVARRLAEGGASVAIADINYGLAAQSVETLIPSAALPHIALSLDVRSGTSVSHCANSIREQFGGLDVWINAAGIFPAQPFLTMTEAHWDATLNINLRGTFLCGRAAAELMIEGKKNRGVIVNVSSTSGHRGRPGLSHYVASKHGLEGLTKSMALELGTHGIRVVCVAPALTRTDGLNARRQSGDVATMRATAALEKKVADSIPLGRIGEPDDIARVVFFLVSDLASFVSGSSILVDGGQLAY